MEGLQYQLVVQAETMALDRMPGSNVTLYSKVLEIKRYLILFVRDLYSVCELFSPCREVY